MELRIDSRSFTNLAKAVRAAEPQLRTGLLAGLRAGGNIVAADARERASFSSRIPGSIRVRTRSTGSVTILAGGPQALDASVLEHKGVAGTFRHPVFGNRDLGEPDGSSLPAPGPRDQGR